MSSPIRFLSRRFQFVVRCDDGRRRRSVLVGERSVTFGRDPRCTIPLADPTVAARHASLERIEDRLLVLSLGDRDHPVLVDGVPVEAAQLEGTELVVLGRTRLHLSRDTTLGPYFLRARDFVRTHFAAIAISAVAHVLLLAALARITWRTDRPDVFEFNPQVSLVRRTEALEDLLPGGGEGLLHDDLPAARLEADSSIGAPEPLKAEAPLLPAPADAQLDPPIGSGTGSIRAGAGGVGGTGGSAETGAGGGLGLGGGFGGGSGGFGRRVAELREHGLDLAIVFDSTSSMAQVIEQVKRDLTQMVNVIAQVAPDSRIALVTYKGLPDFGPVTLATDFVSDRYEMLNFLDRLHTDGGAPDARSAMKSGLELAVKTLGWRAGAGHVLVILGDAPPFTNERRRMAPIAAAFQGRLSTVYKATGGPTEAALAGEAIDAMKELARGKGEFIDYDGGAAGGARSPTGESSVVKRLVSAALGSAYSAEVEHVFALQRDTTERGIVQRRLAARDYDWLFSQFARRRVHPSIVDGLMGIGGGYIAQRLRFLLATQSAEAPFLRARCLYVLRHLTQQWDLDYDPEAAAGDRDAALLKIDAAIRAAFE